MTCTISEEEELDLFTFLNEADVEYCDFCGWSVNVRSYGRHNICRDCVTKLIHEGRLVVCSSCGEVKLVEEMNQVQYNEHEIHYLCDNCAPRFVTKCEECGEIILKDYAQSYYDDNGARHYVCKTCASKYPICEECDHISKQPLIDGLCPTCYNNAIWKGSDVRYHYHDWGRHWNFYNDDGTITIKPRSGVMYMGSELEIDSHERMSTDTTVTGLNRHLKGIAHYERDGSLSDRGIEIISMPMTLDEHMKRKDIMGSAYEYVDNRNYYCDRHTGLHVHVSCSHLQPKHHNRLIYVMNKYKAEIIKMCRRTSSYAEYYTIERVTGFNEITGSVLNQYREWLQGHCGHGIYLNYAKYPDSIEFRMFGGTLDIDYYIGTLQFVYRVMKIAETVTLDELRESHFDTLFYGYYDELDKLLKETGAVEV